MRKGSPSFNRLLAICTLLLVSGFFLLQRTGLVAAAHRSPVVVPTPEVQQKAPLAEKEAETALSAALDQYRQYWSHQSYREGVAALVEVQNRFGISPWTMCALMMEESSMNSQAISNMDARGLVQMLPTTAPGVARRNKINFVDEGTLHQVGPSILLGGAYLRELKLEFSGNEVAALTAYNRGAGATRKRFRKYGRYHSTYAWKVLESRMVLAQEKPAIKRFARGFESQDYFALNNTKIPTQN